MLCLLLVGRRKENKKKEKRSDWGVVFSGLEVSHALLAVPSWIFAPVRCN
jgi:hypothetical protein